MKICSKLWKPESSFLIVDWSKMKNKIWANQSIEPSFQAEFFVGDLGLRIEHDFLGKAAC